MHLYTVTIYSYTFFFKKTSPKDLMFSLAIVCFSVCLLVSKITQKLLNRFSQNLMEWLHIGHRGTHSNFGADLAELKGIVALLGLG